jgi:predicted ribosome quality control (RQC) complex YloA/Tae2 family protein
MDADQSPVDVQRGGRARLTLGAAHLAELVAELRPLFEGARVKEVAALPPRDVLLVVDSPAGEGARTLRLRVSADADQPRVHAVAQRIERHRGPPGPFYRELADELAGARIAKLEQVAHDRLLRIEFRDTPSGEVRALLAELTGRHANLLLLGPAERLRAWLVAPPPAVPNRPARLTIGSAWTPPPGRGGAKAGERPLAETLPEPAEPAPELAPAVRAPLSWRVESALGAEVEELRLHRGRKQLEERLARKLGKLAGLEQGLSKRLEAAQGAERVRQDGELLKVNLGQLRRGMASVDLADLFTEGAPSRRIALDPRRGPRENVEAWFERYKKLLRGAENVEAELELARARRAACEQLLARTRIESADPEALAEEALRQGVLEPEQEADPRKREPPPPRKPYREFTALRGASVLVGRTAADNDVLTLRIARGNDLWFHTRDSAGSHVVLRLARGGEPDPEEVLDAATLALHFSPLRGAKRAAIHVARRKEVHKPKGAKPGLVALSGGKVIDLRAQPERLERLLATARGPAPDASSDSRRAEPRENP